ncbi:hypothetical protein E2C01_043010 [Portunus trituberculatus]|uniref:Uncharacterized protein n=1 Tax=Portunus trituberculatus TaxID=210409 RepID=A0A5B7FY27_PORTR|nr:hypothetical protein [Portunus trituberculatus]
MLVAMLGGGVSDARWWVSRDCMLCGGGGSASFHDTSRRETHGEGIGSSHGSPSWLFSHSKREKPGKAVAWIPSV